LRDPSSTEFRIFYTFPGGAAPAHLGTWRILPSFFPGPGRPYLNTLFAEKMEKVLILSSTLVLGVDVLLLSGSEL